ncbi:MAG TPA: sialidase family protein, partial [Polyangiaceae bacterium]|nr:sialidase family protein [Polyangiaceae bacterium]
TIIVPNDCGADLTRDPQNCGLCGNVCAIPNAFPTCEASFCVIDRCALGFYDENGVLEDGCEYACEPVRDADGEAITEELECDGRDDDCDGGIDEIFDTDADIDHCGACNHACEAPPHVVMSCVDGECVHAGCAEDYADTNGDLTAAAVAEGTSDGCECNLIGQELCNLVDDDCDGEIDEGIELTSDPLNCGACGHTCGDLYPNGATDCVDATCEFAGCLPGFYDVDLELLNGCEYPCDPAAPGVELCDGEDNDCNGFTDDEPTDVGGDCGESTGVCEPGTYQCEGGGLVCSGGVGPATEVCNGLDDDCDIVTDEGCPTLGAVSRLDRGTDPAEFSSAQLTVTAVGSTVIATWLERRASADVYSSYSVDGGETWSDPAAAIASSNNQEIEPWVFASPTRAYLVYGRYVGGDDPPDDDPRRINLTSNALDELDTGWTARVQVEQAPPAGSDSFYGRGIVARAGATGDEDQLVVVWQTLVTATASRDVYLQASEDGGATWLASNVRVNDRAADDLGRAELPSLATDGAGKVFIAYRDAISGRPEARLDVWDFAAAGADKLQGPTELSATDDLASVKPPVLAADAAGNVHVLWTELPDNDSERVRVRSSTDGGATFGAGFTVSQPPPGARPDADTPAIAARDGVAIAAWEDTRAGLANVYAARWSDGAWSAPVKADGGGRGEFRAVEPRVAFGAGSRVFVAYRGFRGDGGDDQADVYVNFSDAAGSLVFQPQALRVDAGDVGARDSFGPRLVPLDSSPNGLLVWLDNLDGANADPYGAVIEF